MDQTTTLADALFKAAGLFGGLSGSNAASGATYAGGGFSTLLATRGAVMTPDASTARPSLAATTNAGAANANTPVSSALSSASNDQGSSDSATATVLQNLHTLSDTLHRIMRELRNRNQSQNNGVQGQAAVIQGDDWKKTASASSPTDTGTTVDTASSSDATTTAAASVTDDSASTDIAKTVADIIAELSMLAHMMAAHLQRAQNVTSGGVAATAGAAATATGSSGGDALAQLTDIFSLKSGLTTEASSPMTAQNDADTPIAQDLLKAMKLLEQAAQQLAATAGSGSGSDNTTATASQTGGTSLLAALKEIMAPLSTGTQTAPASSDQSQITGDGSSSADWLSQLVTLNTDLKQSLSLLRKSDQAATPSVVAPSVDLTNTDNVAVVAAQTMPSPDVTAGVNADVNATLNANLNSNVGPRSVVITGVQGSVANGAGKDPATDATRQNAGSGGNGTRGASLVAEQSSTVATAASQNGGQGGDSAATDNGSTGDRPSSLFLTAGTDNPAVASGKNGQSGGIYSFANQLSTLRVASNTVAQATVVDQVVLQLSRGVKNGDDQMTLQLHPADLGKITVKLDIGADGKVQGTVTAENPKTLEMLQKDSKSLERALQDAGLRADPGSLQFNQGGQPGNQGQARQSADGKNNGDGTFSALSGMDDGGEMLDVADAETYYITPGGVNIQV